MTDSKYDITFLEPILAYYVWFNKFNLNLRIITPARFTQTRLEKKEEVHELHFAVLLIT
jgi:hypothetical protein